LELEPTIYSDAWILNVFLFFCFMLLAISRHIDAQLFVVMFYLTAYWDVGSVFKKKGVHLTRASVILLSLLTLISVSICLTLCAMQPHSVHIENVSFRQSFFDSLLFLFLFFIYQFVCLWFVGWLSGEQRVAKKIIRQLFINLLWWGVFVFLFAAVWLLNISLSDAFYEGFVICMIVFVCVVTAKIFGVCFRERVPWYYIILYLCSLEFLPLLLLETSSFVG